MVAVEHEAERFVVRLGGKHTDCLAKELCGVAPAGAAGGAGCCGTGGCG